ncbi:MAG: putative enoyl-CoA hydratase/isomerase [Myxococcales bacterium]
METWQTIRLSIDDLGIAELTFHRPEVRNALNRQMVEEARAAVRVLAERDDLRAVVLTGAGDRAFLGGADIAELRDRTKLDALRRINTGLFREVEQLPVPTIAAIRGFALGGGCELALACDLRVAGRSARLGQPEVGLGIVPGAGAMYRLPRLIGPGRAKELIFTGRIIGADEALSMGLVNRVVDDEVVLDVAHEIAREIGRNSAMAVRFAKLVMNVTPEVGSDAGMALEVASQAVLFEDDDKQRRMTAFLERRARKAGPETSE